MERGGASSAEPQAWRWRFPVPASERQVPSQMARKCASIGAAVGVGRGGGILDEGRRGATIQRRKTRRWVGTASFTKEG